MRAVEALALVGGYVDKELLFPRRDHANDVGEVKCSERIGGLLKFYHREAA
ncbi:MAG: hypothetical protein V2A73_07335 [Pseudomonadota bacterium]